MYLHAENQRAARRRQDARHRVLVRLHSPLHHLAECLRCSLELAAPAEGRDERGVRHDVRRLHPGQHGLGRSRGAAPRVELDQAAPNPRVPGEPRTHGERVQLLPGAERARGRARRQRRVAREVVRRDAGLRHVREHLDRGLGAPVACQPGHGRGPGHDVLARHPVEQVQGVRQPAGLHEPVQPLAVAHHLRRLAPEAAARRRACCRRGQRGVRRGHCSAVSTPMAAESLSRRGTNKLEMDKLQPSVAIGPQCSRGPVRARVRPNKRIHIEAQRRRKRS
uniref:Uncharacterized protein n=1 Tax=Triticum urartu TaxID=4572 RepID=A0A8R7UA21_TRIUA